MADASETLIAMPATPPPELVRATVLPSSVPREIRGRIWNAKINGWMVPIFCANCGCDGGTVPEAMIASGTGFAFYFCEPCAATWSGAVDHAVIPDRVFWDIVNQTMLERDGRILTNDEQAKALTDPTHYLAKLAKDRVSLTPKP